MRVPLHWSKVSPIRWGRFKFAMRIWKSPTSIWTNLYSRKHFRVASDIGESADVRWGQFL